MQALIQDGGGGEHVPHLRLIRLKRHINWPKYTEKILGTVPLSSDAGSAPEMLFYFLGSFLSLD